MSTKAELLKTQEVLQRAHDQIEELGFDVGSYGVRVRRKGVTVLDAPACYIGNVRAAAGVTAMPRGGGFKSRADSGDGPELTLALSILDDIAKQKKTKKWQLPRYIPPFFQFNEQHVGRYIERVGMSGKHTKRQALEVFRKALTDVHNKLEAA